MNKKGERSMKKTREEKGITLIALIITIVVLMILAAVAINSITNEGILSQSGSTANQYNQAVLNEQTSLQDYEDMLTAANGGYKDKSFEVGDLVKVGTEEFYVIEDKTSLGKVVLLAKGNIDTETLVQDGEGNEIAFSETNYWADEEGNILDKYEIKEGKYYDLTETGVPDASHYAARAAYDYGVKIGGKGRLMTYSEVGRIIDPVDDPDFWERFRTVNFWYCSAKTDTSLWGCMIGIAYDYGPFNEKYAGVRPVIEISKSKVTAITE